jgi:hypothetical protein
MKSTNSAMAGPLSGAGTAGASAAGSATTALQLFFDTADGAGRAPPAETKAARAPNLSAALRAVMLGAFLGLWMIDVDVATRDHSRLASAASLGGEGTDPLEVSEAEAKERAAWVFGSANQHLRANRCRRWMPRRA